jgi:hypothetical protein
VIERAGAYQLQAAIAACHARATSWEATDWRLIVAHYRALERVAPSPVIELNCAVAIGLADGPEAGLNARRPARCLGAARLPPPARRRAPISSVDSGAGRRRPASTGGRSALADNARERTFLAARLAACEERRLRDRRADPPRNRRTDTTLRVERALAFRAGTSRHPDLFSMSSGFGSAGGATVTGVQSPIDQERIAP